MAFTEKIKLEVKQKAMFQCCRCKQTGIDVHHINPQKEGGPDTINNAAPLCQNCHDQFGDNPQKRKEITQMRDLWYKTVEKMYSNKTDSLFPLIEKMNSGLDEIKRNQIEKDQDITDMKNILKEISNKVIDNMTAGTASVTASNMIKASGASLSNQNIDSIPTVVLCKHCKMLSILNNEYLYCPHCAESLAYYRKNK